MTAGTVLALALVIALGLTEAAIYARLTGHSVAHVVSLGIVPDPVRTR